MHRKSQRRLRDRSAFTLIELLVVIVILGVLMAVALPTYLRQQSKAKDNNAKQQLTYAYRAIRSALPEYNNTYPVVASIVSAIQQSEPELTVASGGCNGSSNDKQVEVDPTLSNGSKLALYTKSGSGNWFRLSASPSGAQTFTQLGTCQGALSTGAATTTGNEITDPARTASVQGDGLANDSSFGIWEATTNLVTNGGFETSSTSAWTTVGLAFAYTRAAEQAKFGSWSMKIVRPSGVAGYLGIQTASSNAISVSGGSTVTVSAWVYNVSVSAAPSSFGIDIAESAGGSAVGPSPYHILPVSVPTGQWTRLTYTQTLTASTDSITIGVFDATGSGSTWYTDGVQAEAHPFATPYVETTSGTASRTAAGVRFSSSLLDITKGWAAFRVRPEWPSSTSTGNGFYLFQWYDSTGGINGLDIYFDATHWSFYRRSAGSGPGLTTPAQSFAAGAEQTVVFAWTATQIGYSLNGAAFAWQSNTYIPTMGTPLFSVGYKTSSPSWFDGEIIWFACGKGTLNDSDAASINGWGDTDPTSQDFPSAAQATMAWSADSSSYVTGN